MRKYLRAVASFLCAAMFSLMLTPVYSADENLPTFSLEGALNNIENWSTSGKSELTKEEKGLKLSGGSAIACYEDEFGELDNRLLEFTITTNVDDEGKWTGVYLRDKSGTEPFWMTDATKNYGFVIKKDIIELQKGGDIIKEEKNPSVKTGVPAKIQFGTFTVDNSVRIVLNIDGNKVFDYVDTDEPLLQTGNLTVYGYTSDVVIGVDSPVGIYKLDDAINNAPTWQTSAKAKLSDAKFNQLTLTGTDAVATLTGADSDMHNKLLSFVINTDVSQDGRWVGISVRNTAVAKAFWDEPESNAYTIVFKRNLIEVQKDLKGNNEVVQTIETSALKSNKYQNIQFGAINEDKAVRVLLYINGEKIVDYLDEKDPILTEGNFTVLAYTNPVTLRTVATPAEVEDYTALLTDNRPEQIVEYTFTGNTYYVSPTGDDKNPGTKAQPWRTIAHAASMVEANHDHTIMVAEGNYTENEQIRLKSGVNLIGAGMEKSVVFCKYDGYALMQEYGKNNTIAGFTFDGLEQTSPCAIYIKRAEDLVVTDLFLRHFKSHGIIMVSVKRADVYNLILKDNASVIPNVSGDTATLEITASDSEVHDLIIRESVGKGIGTGPTAEDGTIAANVDLGRELHRVKFYNMDIDVPAVGNWEVPGTGYYPCAIAMEIFGADVEDVEIYDSVINNNLSLVSSNNRGKPTYTVHNVYFPMQGYTFEISAHNMHIYENVIDGGYDEFATWGAVINNNRIHNNLIIPDRGGLWTFANAYNNFNFTHNTVVFKNSGLFHSDSTTQKNFNIENNLFVYDNGGDVSSKDFNINGVSNFDNNMYVKFKPNPNDQNAITADDAKFKLTGESLLEQYSLAEDSPARNAGKAIYGVTAADGQPDIGALEYGEAPFHVGVRQDRKLKNVFHTGPDATEAPAAIDYSNYFEKIYFLDTTGYVNQTQYKFTERYNLTQKNYDTAFVVQLKDGSFDGLKNYIGVDGMDIAYEIADTEKVTVNEEGTVILNQGGETKLIVSLKKGDQTMISGDVTVKAPDKLYEVKRRYFAGYSDDAWTFGNCRPGTPGSSDVGYANSPGDGVEYHVGVEKAGKYRVIVHYGTADSIGLFRITVNDEFIEDHPFKNTGNWSNWEHYEMTLDLKEGKNDIKFIQRNNAVNFRELTVHPIDQTEVIWDEFNELLAQCDAQDQSLYTAEAWEKFQTSVEKAKALVANDEKDQEVVDDMYYSLKSAYGALENTLKVKQTHYPFINGMPDGTFRPSENLTRAQVAVMLTKAVSDGSVPDSTSTSFADVPADGWYSGSVKQLADMGAISGYQDGTFGPDRQITRAEFVSMLSNLFEPKKDVGQVQFGDVESHWALEKIAKAGSAGWIQGSGDNMFRPDDNITRAEAVVALLRAMGRDPLISTTQPVEAGFSDMTAEHWAYPFVLEASKQHNAMVLGEKENWTK